MPGKRDGPRARWVTSSRRTFVIPASFPMGPLPRFGSLHGLAVRREPIERRLAGQISSLYVLTGAPSNLGFRTSRS